MDRPHLSSSPVSGDVASTPGAGPLPPHGGLQHKGGHEAAGACPAAATDLARKEPQGTQHKPANSIQAHFQQHATGQTFISTQQEGSWQPGLGHDGEPFQVTARGSWPGCAQGSCSQVLTVGGRVPSSRGEGGLRSRAAFPWSMGFYFFGVDMPRASTTRLCRPSLGEQEFPHVQKSPKATDLACSSEPLGP